MTARQKRNAIIWPIVGGVIFIAIIVLFVWFNWDALNSKDGKKIYNVKYTSSEPVMEFTRKSERETEANDGLMYGYIYIDGEKVDIECRFGRYANKLDVFYLGESSKSGDEIDWNHHEVFTAKYTLKGDTLTLRTFDTDEYLIKGYSKITLTMTHLS